MDLVFKTVAMLHKTDYKDDDLKFIRMRTKKGIEIIVTIHKSYTLIALQDCTKVAEVKAKVEAKVEGEEMKV